MSIMLLNDNHCIVHCKVFFISNSKFMNIIVARRISLKNGDMKYNYLAA